MRLINLSQPRSSYLWLSLLGWLMLSGMPFFTFAQDASDLETIQRQIKDKQAKINKETAEAKKLQASLKKVELEIAKSAKALNQTEISLENNKLRQGELTKQQKGYLSELDKQQSVLAKQLRSAFMTGNYDFAKMLLNQQDAANFERTITYYQYLNKARKSQIDNFKQLVKDLQQVNAQLIEQQQQLEQLQGQQLQQQETLKSQQSQREDTLAKMQSSIESEELKVLQLQTNEQNLIEALAQALQDVEDQNVTLAGLSRLKGRLLMPAKGTLRKMFGRFRQGQIRWKGVVIRGSAGSQVVAIHHAKVLFADWLRGFGLVTVLDHGDGFMSLYGHNQALLKQAGDTVQAGEAIALLGQSGGQSRPNLYFEIRHKGKPINPVSWLKL